MKKYFKSEIAVICWRLLLLYILLAIIRFVFYIYNINVFQEIITSPYDAWRLFVGCFKFDTASILYTNSLWILLSLIPAKRRAKKWYNAMLFWIYMVTNTLLLTLINTFDIVYYKYTLKKITSEEFHFLSNDNNAQLFWQFTVENWWLVIFVIIITYALSKFYFRGAQIYISSLRSLYYYPIHIVVLIIAIANTVIGIRGFILNDIPISISHAAFYTKNPTHANIIVSNPFYIIRTVGKFTTPDCNYFSQEVADSIFIPYHFPNKTATPQPKNYKDYNVVVVIMESFSAEYSAYLHPQYHQSAPEGDTPFLDSLMRSSITMKKMYANGNLSIKAMPSILGSIPSFIDSFAEMPQSIGESRQLPAILKESGYSTSFFCGSRANSMGFNSYGTLAGIDTFKAKEDYEAIHGTNDFNGSWGIWDEEFLGYMADEINQMKEPFFTSVFTTSSHHPHEIPARYEDIIAKDISKSRRTIRYTDTALRNFYNKCKGEPWFDNTIFVFVADHVSGAKENKETYQYPANHHIIGFIHTPDGSLKQEVNEITQQLDLMPTLLGLLGNKEPYFAFGRDILNDSKRPKWSIEYNNQFIATTQDGVIDINESDTLKALVQQYYKHIKEKRYVVE